MRKIETFVLRLLVDAEEPDRLCGSLQPVATDEEHPFVDAPALVLLLQRLTGLKAPARAPRPENGSARSPGPVEDEKAASKPG